MKKYTLLFILSIVLTTGCRDYLDVKPEKNLVVPRGLEELSRLTDNATTFNSSFPGINIMATDELQVDDTNWSQFTSPKTRGACIWDYSEGFEFLSEWRSGYEQVYYANVILDELKRLQDKGGDEALYNVIRGRSLFFRGHAFFNLISLFTLPYNTEKSGDQLGIPIRLTPDIDAPVSRQSLEVAYDQVLEDLERCIPLLPEKTEIRTRPDQISARGLLARIYLQLGRYEESLDMVSQMMEYEDELMDYNSLDSTDRYPFSFLNKEVLWQGELASYSFFRPYYIISADLMSKYQEGDLRKKLFFNQDEEGGYHFRGSYLGDHNIFGGISMNEIYLIRAECLVHIGEIEDGLMYLNELLKNRYETGTYQLLSGLSQEAALNRIIDERRKELIFRQNRWLDLRRLSREKGREVILSRNVNGQTYQLLPNSNRYAFPIPVDEIQLTGMKQNPM